MLNQVQNFSKKNYKMNDKSTGFSLRSNEARGFETKIDVCVVVDPIVLLHTTDSRSKENSW